KVASTIKGIAQQAPDFRKGNMEAREQMLKLLKAEKFDKDELERLRAERIKAIDEASKKVVQALGEVADTLTPKQRQELVELAEKRRRMFGRH
ncbi:MAG: Spy/CpxP family protein refolding chaperone, partial [Beijerinckiaceae bacterium]